MANPKPLRWGIMATGGIARTFVRDILISPSTRGAPSIVHHVTAVASSSSLDSARRFISINVNPSQPTINYTPYDSYASLTTDPKVKIIYIATPHSHHYQNAMLILTAPNPKHILCEKALTVTSAQTRALFTLAKDRGIFFMEAFPLSLAIRQHIQDGLIGEILRVSADLSIGADVEKEFSVEHRMINLDLAGGALLDLGVYSLTWVFQALYHTLPLEKREAPKVVGASMVKEARTGADEATVVLLEMRSAPTGKYTAQAVATTSLRANSNFVKEDDKNAAPAVRIQGEKGEIQVFGPIYRPTRFRSLVKATDGKVSVEDKGFEFEEPHHGMGYEADACAEAILIDKKQECETMGWEESQAIMDVMSEIIQRCGLKYPDSIVSHEGPGSLDEKS